MTSIDYEAVFNDGDYERLSRVDELTARLLDSAALKSMPKQRMLIDEMIYCGSLFWIHGKAKSYKSVLALDWASCISTGLPWEGHEVTQGPVLYVVAEGAAGLPARVAAWEDRAKCSTNVTFLPVAVQMLSHIDPIAVRIVAENMGAIMVFLDTQARVTVGMEENSGKDMGQLIQAADSIRDDGKRAVGLVHHEPRNGENPRGHGSQEGAADHIFRTERKGDMVRLSNTMQKDMECSQTLSLWEERRAGSIVLTSDKSRAYSQQPWECSENERKIIETLSGGLGASGLASSVLIEMTGLPKSTYYRALDDLVSKQSVVNKGSKARPLWSLA